MGHFIFEGHQLKYQSPTYVCRIVLIYSEKNNWDNNLFFISVPTNTLPKCMDMSSTYHTTWVMCPRHHEIAIYQEVVGVKQKNATYNCRYISYSLQDCIGNHFAQTDSARFYCNAVQTCPRYYTQNDLPLCGAKYENGQSYSKISYSCIKGKYYI